MCGWCAFSSELKIKHDQFMCIFDKLYNNLNLYLSNDNMSLTII